VSHFHRALGLALALAVTARASDGIDDLRRMYAYDANAPLDAKETLLYERDGVKVYDLSYASPKGGRVTAYRVAPVGAGRHAGVAFGHWGPGNRTEFLPEATLYARSGVVSVLVDYPWTRPAPWRKPLRQDANPEGDQALFVQAVVDLRRALDLLAARPDVDPNRLGYVGHSFGAQWGAVLSAVEPRLKAAALMAGVPDQAAIWRDNDDPGVVAWRANTPKDKQEAYLAVCDRTAAVRYVPHARCPLLLQFAQHERYFDKAAMDRYAAAAPKGTPVTWYHTGHELNDPQALTDRAAWLRDKLGIAGK
jgi:dienelactone hydrolase